MPQDEEHLRMLSIFHYVLAGIVGFFGLFPIIHVVVGLVFIIAPPNMQDQGDMPPQFMGWMFLVAGAMAMLFSLSLAALVFATGRCIAKRKYYMFCFVIAGIECTFMPMGTVLGVFTIIVLIRDSVKKLFSAGKAPDKAIAAAGG